MVSTKTPMDSVLFRLKQHVSAATAESVFHGALKKAGVSLDIFQRVGLTESVADQINRGVSLFLTNAEGKRQFQESLRSLIGDANASARGGELKVPITDENGVVDARTKARSFALEVGFSHTDQVKIATAVSELARNIANYAGAGSITLTALATPRAGVKVVAADGGPGIPNLPVILAGDYKSKTGMGLGLLGCRKLMHEFDIRTGPTGTVVTMAKYL